MNRLCSAKPILISSNIRWDRAYFSNITSDNGDYEFVRLRTIRGESHRTRAEGQRCAIT